MGRERKDYDSELEEGIRMLSEVNRSRAELAFMAARKIADGGGQTDDLELWYLAMYGKVLDEGKYDPNFGVPQSIINDIDEPESDGKLLLIKNPVASIDTAPYQITRFPGSEKGYKLELEFDGEYDEFDGASWSGGLALALRRMWPKSGSGFTTDESVSTVRVCERYALTSPSGLEIGRRPASLIGGLRLDTHIMREAEIGTSEEAKTWVQEVLAERRQSLQRDCPRR